MTLQRLIVIAVIGMSVIIFGGILAACTPLVYSYYKLPSHSAFANEPSLTSLGFGDPKGAETKLPPKAWKAPTGFVCAACWLAGPDRNACNSHLAGQVAMRKERRHGSELARIKQVLGSIADVIVMGLKYPQQDLLRLYAADHAQALGYDSIDQACSDNFGVSCAELSHEDGVMLSAVFSSGVRLTPGETPSEGLAATYANMLRRCPFRPSDESE